jgi:predicted transcriptional regulator
MSELIENIDYVVCQICGKRLKRITNYHLKLHATNTDEYLITFPETSLISKKYLENLSKGVKKFHHTEEGQKILKEREKRYLERKKKREKEEAEKYLNKIENIDYVVCQICQKKLGKITPFHLSKKHNLTMSQYIQLFPKASLSSEKSRLKVVSSLKQRDPIWIENASLKRALKQSEINKKISETSSNFWVSEEGIQRKEEIGKKGKAYWSSEKGKGVLRKREEKYNREEMSKKSSQTLKNLFQTEEGKKILEERNIYIRSSKIREKNRQKVLKAQQNPEYWKKKHKSQTNSPNNFEKAIINMLPSSFRFTGDKNPEGIFYLKNGRVKNADFISPNKTKVIECFGDFWHGHKRNIGNQTPEDHMKEVINNYKEIGVDCLVIWENELKNKENLQLKIHKFLQPSFYI